MDSVKVGTAIKTLRLQAGYTQQDLAECLNVTDKAVSKWERGLSVPDISIITKLSLLLNCDVDNLLEGNLSYLEKTWQGFLIIGSNEKLFIGSKAYGKPLVYFYISYFMLAGIGEIYISCSAQDREYIDTEIGDGSQYGIQLHFLSEGEKLLPVVKNTMVVYNNPFIYGPNLTRYFQRAMSRTNGISVLTIEKAIGNSEIVVSYDNYKAIRGTEGGGRAQFCIPIVFVPKRWFVNIANIGNIADLNPLYAEPVGNGMIEYSITDEESLLDTAYFLRYLKKCMGKEIYDLAEISKNRNFI